MSTGLNWGAPDMTPLERLIDDHVTAFRLRQWYELNDWQEKTRAEIKALADSHHRSIGQLVRHATARVQRAFLPQPLRMPSP